jgi:hypothetical protein
VNVDIKKIDGNSVTFNTPFGNTYIAFAFPELEEEWIDKNIEVEISCLELGDLCWEDIFNGNKDKQKKLVKSNRDWSYEGYGQIISINPIVVDFGDLELELGEWTHDERVVGEYIYWKIDRLDLFHNWMDK